MENKNHIKINEIHTVNIDRFGAFGEGVAKINGFTVFVPGALPGETVDIRINLCKKSYATGKLIKIITPSSEREIPPCPIYEECGGCQLQHLNYKAQLDFKKSKVTEAIERIGKINIDVEDTIGADSPWYYRNKMMFPVGTKKSEIVIGCYALASHQVIDTDNCLIQNDINNKITRIVKVWMKNNKIAPYDEKSKTGRVRHIMGRVGVKTGDVMVAVITAKKIENSTKELVELLKKELPSLKSVLQIINKKSGNVVLDGEESLIYGQNYIEDKIGDFTFTISAKSFFQVNNEQTHKLYEKAYELAALDKNQTVIEAYSGTGSISMYLASGAKKVIGIEIVEDAVLNARKNAQKNNCENVEFILGDVGEVSTKLLENGVKADVVVVDPPRAGCDEKTIANIIKLAPEKIIYISCNSASLARDLAKLEGSFYKTKICVPVDMFPMTNHVEVVALIERKKP